jgi:solute carrier family 25 uncoupling protein 8/9
VFIDFMQFFTLPLDTAKIKLQLQKKAAAVDGVGTPKYSGLLGTVATIAREEGLSALWKGLIPGLMHFGKVGSGQVNAR